MFAEIKLKFLQTGGPNGLSFLRIVRELFPAIWVSALFLELKKVFLQNRGPKQPEFSPYSETTFFKA